MKQTLGKTALKAFKYVTFGKLILKSAPMFHRFGRNARPMWHHITRRGHWQSKRDIPIQTIRQGNPWEVFNRDPMFWRHAPWVTREVEYWRRVMNKFFQPRTYDAYYVRPRCQRFAEEYSRSEVEQVKYDKNGFEVKLDVQNFTPSELEVKLAGNRLSVSGKHEQRADVHGYVAREFHREFEIPEDVDLETLNSSLSEEGFLTVQAGIKGAPEKPPEKKIEIKFELNKPENKGK